MIRLPSWKGQRWDAGKASRVAPAVADPAGPHPSQRSLRGLDWFIFFVADVQTGFGPFVSVYLTTQKWTQVDIGLVLTVRGLVALLGQMPGGMAVDAIRSERLAAGLAISTVATSALILALWPILPIVLTASVMQAAASCVLGPAIAAISLGLVGHAAIGERLGRNARFASIGSGLAAAAMGACGHFLSARAVFFVTALLLVPALIALRYVSPREVDPESAHGGPATPAAAAEGSSAVFKRRPLLVFAGCIMLFHLANAAMLPLMGSVLTMRSSAWATVLIAACIVAPQIVVAIFSEWVGRMAGVWGRRPLLLVAFATLPVRGVLFAVVTDPYALVAVQLLDGVAGAVLAVVVTLVVVDLTRGTGHFNLGQGLVGTGMGIGASLSTTLAGYLTDRSGSSSAFTGLAAVAVVALVAVWALVKETKPADPNGSAQSPPRQKRALALVRPDIRLPGRKRVEWTRWLRSRLRWAQCSPAVRRLFAGATPLRVSRHRNEFAAEASTSEPSRELLAAPKTIEAPDGHRPDGRPVAADS